VAPNGVILKKSHWIAAIVFLVLFVLLFIWGNKRFPFDFGVFWSQVKLANWTMIGIGVACIYSAYIFRSVRWAWLMHRTQRVHPLSLIGTQIMGFTAIALIGRVADPVRPFLVSRKTGSPLATQIAIYIVERLFDFGAMALIICAILLACPLDSVPHPEIVRKAGYGGLVATAGAALFLLLIRLSGPYIASLFEKLFGLISPALGRSAGHKIRTFHAGLDTMRTFWDFAATLIYSLLMWALIFVAYIVTLRAFTASPELANMDLPGCVLLMAISGGASAIQLPVVGWFSQIAFVMASLIAFFHVPHEAATASAAVLLFVTFLCIVPAGLLWAQFSNISLRSVARESGHAEEVLEAEKAD
jgi:uncharacterized membrane protein YbhN (UPF0104 family)